MTITKKWLKECASPESGGYTSAQFEVLKTAGLRGLIFSHGTAQSGWKDIIIGQDIADELAVKFYEFRTKYKNSTINRKLKKQDDDINLSLF